MCDGARDVEVGCGDGGVRRIDQRVFTVGSHADPRIHVWRGKRHMNACEHEMRHGRHAHDKQGVRYT